MVRDRVRPGSSQCQRKAAALSWTWSCGGGVCSHSDSKHRHLLNCGETYPLVEKAADPWYRAGSGLSSVHHLMQTAD